MRSWYPSGNLSRELVYDENSELESINGWTPGGDQLPKESFAKEDYFEKMTAEIGVLTKSLDGISQQIGIVVPFLEKEGKGGEEESEDFSQDIKELEAEMTKLKNIHQQMHQHATETSSETKDAIWKTPETRRLMGKQLEETSQKMAEDILALEEVLKMTMEMLEKGTEDASEEKE